MAPTKSNSSTPTDVDAREALKEGLKATLAEHDLRLVEVTWRENFEKRTLTLGLKVTGELDRQLSLDVDGAGTL